MNVTFYTAYPEVMFKILEEECLIVPDRGTAYAADDLDQLGLRAARTE